MSLPTPTPIDIIRGDKKVFSFKLSADKAIAGATIRAMFRRSSQLPAIFSKAVGSGIAVTFDVPGNRAFSLTLDGSDTSALKDDEKLVYDIELTYADLDGGYTVARGALSVVPDITR